MSIPHHFHSYKTRPREVLVVRLALNNLEEVARFVSGRVDGDSIDIPTIQGPLLQVKVGSYLIKNYDGSFSVVDNAFVEENLIPEPTTPDN